MSIGIVILNWNGLKDTIECIESLKKLAYPNVKIFVVDNKSLDDEAQKLATYYNGLIQVIPLIENIGFSGGNNAGIKVSLEQKTDFILILNNDTVVEPDFLEPLIKKFEDDEKTGIAAPQINYYSEPGRIWSDGGRIKKFFGSGYAYSDKLENESDKKDKSVTFVSGCCMLVKKEVFREIGLFDENFFLYVEDTDFCCRVLNAGYRIYVVPKSKIYHKVGASTKKDFSSFPLYYTTRNRLYFAKKNFPETYILTILYIFFAMLIKSFGWFFSGKMKKIPTVKKSFEDFFKGHMGRRENEYRH
ncbi:MAG: glycosyltransferase family 2 protein [Ignavibacteria bacterium]